MCRDKSSNCDGARIQNQRSNTDQIMSVYVSAYVCVFMSARSVRSCISFVIGGGIRHCPHIRFTQLYFHIPG